MSKIASILLLIFLFAMVLMLVSCAPKILVTKETKDSVATKIIVHHDTVTIPGENIIVDHIIECDEKTNKPIPMTVTAKNGRAKVTAAIDDNGRLTEKCECDSLKEVLTSRDTITRYFHSSKEVLTKVEYKTHWFDTVARWYTGLSIIGAALFVGLKIRKSSII